MRAPLYDPGISVAAQASARLGMFGALLAAIALGLTALDRLSPYVGLVVLAFAALFGLGALLFALRAMASIWNFGKRGMVPMLTGLFFACLLLAAPAWLGLQALLLPPLHDISTTIRHPPHFSMTLPALAARGGHTPADISAQDRAPQRTAYPDVQPILVDVTPLQAFELALRAARALNWTIVATRAAARHDPTYHIDATHKWPLLHFIDDITIRVEPADGQARVDIRAVSRLDGPDYGNNARLIQQFIDQYQTLVDNLD
ncbi:MAG: DUF1499 domain-containing protein [Hyphomicrobiales bacterium]|nr:DUF1499 domain-containing protein [Hyphomicrobiales bacterium]